MSKNKPWLQREDGWVLSLEPSREDARVRWEGTNK
jgi:hypothetical protein